MPVWEGFAFAPIPQPPDTTKPSSPLETQVDYDAVDTSYFDVRNQIVYLIGQASVDYGDISLTADYIEYDFRNRQVLAYGRLDSNGKMVGRPVFKDATSELEIDSVRYNFDTKKGLTHTVTTQEGDGFLHAQTAKKHSNDDVHIFHGYYTTCNLDTPHYHFQLGKAIVKPNDKIVARNINLRVANIPTPLWVPFAFFPNKKKQNAGIILPTYGESPGLGFFLKDGGYYIPINDRLQTQFNGDIYSRGSWKIGNSTDYKARYKFNGRFTVNYSVIKQSEPEYDDFSRQNEFFVRWNHAQDAKARPGSKFSADVNFGTSTNFQNALTTNLNNYLTNTFTSSVRYTKSFAGTPLSLNVNLRHNQNTQTHLVNLTTPEVALNMTRIYPGKILRRWLAPPGSTTKRAYEKIGVTYNMNMRNDISQIDTLMALNRLDDLINNQMRHGIRHNMSVNTNISPKSLPLTITPSFNATDRWYLQTIDKRYDNELDSLITDTVNGFDRAGEWNANLGFTTKLYGIYGFKGSEMRVRHVMTPNISMRYRPDFGTNETIFDGTGGTNTYSPYQIGVYGAPTTGESGALTFSLINSLEAKVPTPQDTAQDNRKIKILDNFGASTNYDFFKDVNQWAVVSLNARTTLFKNLNLNYTSTYDPYDYDSTGKVIDDSYWTAQNGLGRFSSHRLAASTTLRGGGKTADQRAGNPEDESDPTRARELASVVANPNAYVDFNIPWTLSINYTLGLNNTFSSVTGNDTLISTQTLNFSGDFKLTPQWKVGFSSGYDFVNKGVTNNTAINLYRDLHCWELSFNYIPFGFTQSYNIQLNVKASVLQDLKLARRRSWFDQGF